MPTILGILIKPYFLQKAISPWNKTKFLIDTIASNDGYGRIMAHMIVFKEEDPDSSSEENCALLAATSSESMTRLLVVCGFPH